MHRTLPLVGLLVVLAVLFGYGAVSALGPTDPTAPVEQHVPFATAERDLEPVNRLGVGARPVVAP